MKDALRQKLLTLLAPLPLVALWEFVPENAQSQLSPYKAVCVPAVDVRKVVRVLPFLCTIPRNMRPELKRICAEWHVKWTQNKKDRPQNEVRVDLCNACIQFLAERMDSVVSPAQGAGSALASQREVSAPCVRDTRSAESLASCTLGDLLAGHAEENAEEFQIFKTLVLSRDIVTGVLSLLEVLGGGRQEMRAACSVWKIPRKSEGREVPVETLRSKFREKIVSMLPPVPLAVLLQRVPEEIEGQFSEYVDVFVAAMDVDRVAELLSFLGSWKQQSEPDVLRVCVCVCNVGSGCERREPLATTAAVGNRTSWRLYPFSEGRRRNNYGIAEHRGRYFCFRGCIHGSRSLCRKRTNCGIGEHRARYCCFRECVKLL